MEKAEPLNDRKNNEDYKDSQMGQATLNKTSVNVP